MEKKNFFRKHIVISTILSIIICFFVSVIIGDAIGKILCNMLSLDNQSIAARYFISTVGKIVAIVVSLLLICISGIFRKIKVEHGHMKECGILCLVMIGVAIYNVIGDAIVNQEIAYTQFHLDALIACAFYAFATGILEELVCRVLLFQNMFEKWKTKSSGVWKAILASSLVFGACHLLNFTAGVVPTLFQVYYAVIAGIIFAAMYLISRNIWVCIIIHSLIDFGGAVGYAFMPNDNAMQLAANMSGIDLGSIIVAAVLTVSAVYALILVKVKRR